MAHSERTRPSRNSGASAGQRAVRPRPRLALGQNQLASPDQAKFVFCEQTILAVSMPIMLMLIAGGSPDPGPDDRTLAHRCRRGRPPQLLSNFLLFVRQPPEHHARHGGVEQHLAGLDETLVVAAHAPVSPNPGECPLHHPTSLEHVKATRDLWRRLVGAAPGAA